MAGKIEDLKAVRILGECYGIEDAHKILEEESDATDIEETLYVANRWINLDTPPLKDEFVAGYRDGFVRYETLTREVYRDIGEMAKTGRYPGSNFLDYWFATTNLQMPYFLADDAKSALNVGTLSWCASSIETCLSDESDIFDNVSGRMLDPYEYRRHEQNQSTPKDLRLWDNTFNFK